MSRKEVEWLYQELPELVKAGVLPAENAAKIKQYYGEISDRPKRQTAFTVFGVIGAALIGLGIILILAHNWDQMTRPTRLLISLGLLAAAQLVAGLAIRYKRDSIAWMEGTGTFLTLSVGAAIALVGQTYHLSDDTGKYLLTWMLLALPLVYVMGATIPALLYVVGITLWSYHGQAPIVAKHLVWLLYGLLLPYYRKLMAPDAGGIRFLAMSWFLLISFYFCFGAAFDKNLNKMVMLIYSGLFALTYAGGLFYFDKVQNGWNNPFKSVGLAGIVALVYIVTFKGFWEQRSFWEAALKPGESVLVFVILGASLWFIVRIIRRKSKSQALFGAAPIIVGLGYLLQLYDASGTGTAVLMNAYFLLFALNLIVKGIRTKRLAMLNVGMLLTVGLIGARFLDIEFSFIVRGIVFVALGICFLAANVILARRKGGEDRNEN